MLSQHPLRTVALRIVATIAALFVMYVAGDGPAWCIFRFTESGENLIPALYSPLHQATFDTPLQEPLDAYEEWWAEGWKAAHGWP